MDFSDIVMFVIKGIVTVGGFASLIALCVYIIIIRGIWYGNYSPLLFEMVYGGKSWKKAVFPGLALLGLSVCLFTGLQAMLFWIPDSWGLNDGEGGVQYFSKTIGASFALIGGWLIMDSIEKAIKSKLFLDVLKVTIAGEREIYTATSLAQLETLESDYNKKIEELNEEIKKARKPDYKHSEHSVYMRYEEKIGAYSDLINLIELRKVTIAGEREICRATSLTRLEALEFNYNKKIDDLEDEMERPGYIDESYQKRVNAYHALINLIEARKVTVCGVTATPVDKSLIRLEVFESSYCEKIDDLEEEWEDYREAEAWADNTYVDFSGQEEKNACREQINAYRDLIHLIEIQKVTINGEKEIDEAKSLAQLETLESDYNKKIDDLDVSCHEQRNVYRDLIHLIEFQKIILNGKKEIWKATSLGQMEILESNYNKKIDDLEDEKERPCDISRQKQIKAYLLLRHVIEARINEETE